MPGTARLNRTAPPRSGPQTSKLRLAGLFVKICASDISSSFESATPAPMASYDAARKGHSPHQFSYLMKKLLQGAFLFESILYFRGSGVASGSVWTLCLGHETSNRSYDSSPKKQKTPRVSLTPLGSYIIIISGIYVVPFQFSFSAPGRNVQA